jgi:endogenous inhibitor of DNA gyrase (YacG/DUF329 family)
VPRKVRSLRCPTCRKIVLRDEPDFPFCSERCRLIDLGKWASGAYVISSPIQESDSIGDVDGYTDTDAPFGQPPHGKHDKH